MCAAEITEQKRTGQPLAVKKTQRAEAIGGVKAGSVHAIPPRQQAMTTGICGRTWILALPGFVPRPPAQKL